MMAEVELGLHLELEECDMDCHPDDIGSATTIKTEVEAMNESTEQAALDLIAAGTDSQKPLMCCLPRKEVELGLHSEIDIKFEPEDLKQEQEDCDIDCHSDDYIGSATTFKTEIEATNESTEQAALDLITAGTDSHTNTGASCSNTRKTINTKSLYLPKNNYQCKTKVFIERSDDNDKVTDDILIDEKAKKIKLNKIHQSRIHSAEGYSCTSSENRTENKINIQSRMSARKYICDTCSYVTYRKTNLIRHISIHNKQIPHTSEKLYACKICDKKFTQRGYLKIHTRFHAGKKPYACKICNEKFTQVSSLNRHIRNHTGEKPYACAICDKKFTRASQLDSHIRIHTGQKPYACGTCDKKFTERGSLKIHTRLHTGEKPYACRICDKKFTHVNSLNCHIRTHTSEKPYACKLCDKKFTQKSHLNSHIRTHR